MADGTWQPAAAQPGFSSWRSAPSLFPTGASPRGGGDAGLSPASPSGFARQVGRCPGPTPRGHRTVSSP